MATFNRQQFAKDLSEHRRKRPSWRERSVRAYARAAGVSHMAVTRFEAATSTDLESYARLCVFMGCSMDYYFNSRTK